MITASCGTCLHRHPLKHDRMPLHDAEVEGEGRQECPGSGEPPYLALDLTPGDVLAGGGLVEELVAYDSGDGQYIGVLTGGPSLTLPADTPVTLIGRVSLEAA